MRTPALLAAAAALTAAAVTGCSSTDTTTTSDKPTASATAAGTAPSSATAHADDVRIDTCGTDTYGAPEAKLTVTNSSSKHSDYIVEVEFIDRDGVRQSEGTAVLNNLAPGQAAKDKAIGLENVTGGFNCRVIKVTRHATL
ncbi:hypothetical protein ACFU0X_20695 [Streptomyces cellulosae]|uniref:Lipoprotein n=1 Tax=Streptomyces cellulosae TaxID=1968 RepID=A0ABW6JK64_STRCE